MGRPQHKLYRRYRHPGLAASSNRNFRMRVRRKHRRKLSGETQAVMGHEKPAGSSILIDLVTRRRPALMT
jgi:hypothetical protein